MSYRQKDKNGKPKPDKEVIAKHWLLPLNECWACGVEDPVELHRAHIFPLQSGGTNDCGNFHLLCYVCHYESEHLIEQAYEQWFWLKSNMYHKGKLQSNNLFGWNFLKEDEDTHYSNLQALDDLIYFSKKNVGFCLEWKRVNEGV
jgi:hypothetical protein